jgi:hypothetical protein
LVSGGDRADHGVADGELLVVGVEIALARLRPLRVQPFDLVLAFQAGGDAECVEVVDRVLDHHVGGEDLLVPSSDLQVAVAVVGQQHEPVPRVLGDF